VSYTSKDSNRILGHTDAPETAQTGVRVGTHILRTQECPAIPTTDSAAEVTGHTVFIPPPM